MLDVWLLLYHLFLCRYITKFTFREYIVQLKGNSNLVKLSLKIFFAGCSETSSLTCKKSSDETESITIFSGEIDL